jgi:RNA polymerase sigma factor (sigma-70 family)
VAEPQPYWAQNETHYDDGSGDCDCSTGPLRCDTSRGPTRSGRRQAQVLRSNRALAAAAEDSKVMITAESTCETSTEVGLASFEQLLMPHLGAAYNLARWLTHNDHDAEDLVQEAYLRALKSFDGFRGGDGRAWLLTIVRNTCYTWLRQNTTNKLDAVFDEEIHSGEGDGSTPETLLLESLDSQLLKRALEELPPEFREVLILRELEGLSYREIAEVAHLPLGTVMSRLARARKHLQQQLGRKEQAVRADGP